MTSGKTNHLILALFLIFVLASKQGNCQIESIQVENYIRVKLLTITNFSDETVLRFLPGATKGFDPSTDAYKLFGAQVNVYTMPDSNLKLAINAVPFPSPGDSISLGFNANYGDYRFVFSGLNSFNNNMVLVLTDKLTNGQRILQNSDTIAFSVILNPLSYGYRFKIKYYFPTTIQNLFEEKIISSFIAKSGEYIPKELRQSGKSLTWYSVDGQKIKSGHKPYDVIPNFISGFYFLRTDEETPRTIRAIIQN